MLFLQVHAIEKATVNGYTTGTHDYTRFCTNHLLPIDPTPETMAHYITYTSQFIASGPKYLTGARHFLNNIYPHFNTSCAHPLVKSAICGYKKIPADPVRRKLPLQLHHLTIFLNIAWRSSSYDD